MPAGSHRVTGTLLASGFLGGWLTAVWISPPPAVTQTAPPRPVAAPPAIDVPRVALDRVAAPDTRPETRRNPFTFRDRDVVARPSPAASDTRTAAAEVTAPVEALEQFPWRLVGMATSDDGSFTAVVSGRGDVHLLRLGERLPDDAEVVAIEARQVTVRLASGESRVLDLP